MKPYRIVRFISVFLFLDVFFVVESMHTAQDLTTTYKNAQSEINSLQLKIEPLPEVTKQNLTKVLSDVTKQIEAVYQKTQRALIPLEKQSGYIAQMQLNQEVTSAQEAINQALYTSALNVNNALEAYQRQQGEQRAKTISSKTAQLLKAKATYQEQMEQLFDQLQELLTPYDQILSSLRKFTFGLLHGRPYNVTKVEDLHNQLSVLAQKAYVVYKNAGPLNPDDHSNLLVLILRSMSNFYAELIFQQLQALSNQKQNDAYYKGLADVSIKILGTHDASDTWLIKDGYDGAVKNEVMKYFSDSSDQTKMLDYYTQKKINLTYLLYANALQDMSIQLTNPTALQRSYAHAIYNLIMSEVEVLPQSKTETVAQTAHTSMALLYVASAQAVIKTMQLSQNTEPIVAQIIDFYKQAAGFFSKAHDAQNAQLYANLSKSLMQAAANLKKAQDAQQAGDSATAIQWYTSSQALFRQGGDGIDVNKINIILSDLVGIYAFKKVSTRFNQFISDNKNTIQDYLTFINSLDNSVTMNRFNSLFDLLLTLYQNSYGDYQQALLSYQSVIKNNPTLSQSNETVNVIQNITDSVSLLMTLSQAQAALQSGDQILGSMTVDALQQAGNYYENSLALYQAADTLYKNNNLLNNYVPRYFLSVKPSENLDFTTIANQHIARLDIEFANGMQNDLTTALLYYNDAHNRLSYLSALVDNFITTTLESLSKKTPTIAKLFSDAQTQEKHLLSLSANAWTPQANALGYVSEATIGWQGLLQHYLTIYYLGYTAARDAFMHAVIAYAEQYRKFVPESYYPDLGVAMINYRNYIIKIVENEDTSTIMNEIDQSVSTFFATAQQLIDTVANPTSLTISATVDQQKLIQWSQRMEQALTQQEGILSSVGQVLNVQQTQNARLFEKNVDAQGTITYTFLPTKKTVVLPNPMATLAALYKQLADLYFNQKNYNLAYPYYYYAQQTYLQANQPDAVTSFKAQLALADTLYLASEYRDLIIKQGQVAINSFTVPEVYELKVYGQTIPEVISSSFGDLNALSKNPEQAQELLISLAAQLYFYHKISDAFGADQFEYYSGIIKSKNYAGLSGNEQATLIAVVQNAEQFQKDLTDRVTNKKTSLVLQQENQQSFALYEYYMPVPRFPNITNYYQGYPAAVNYYEWAAYLFKPGSSDETITVGSETLPHGNDQQAYEKMIHDEINLYLSQAHVYQEQIDVLQSGSVWTKLKESNKNDMSLSIADYTALYSTIKNLYNTMIGYYYGPIGSNLVASTDPSYILLNNLIRNTYKTFGDTLAIFLIGNPLSYHYTNVLKDILGNYITAIVTYNYNSDLYATIAQFDSAAGEVLIQQHLYFDSLSFFYTAVTLLQRIKPQTAEIQQQITNAYLNYFGAMFKGSTFNIGKFQNARTGLIAITLSDGTQEKISFDDLLEKYLSFLNQKGGISTQGLDPAEKTKSDQLKNLVLDALIFYNGCNSQAQPVITALVPEKSSLDNVNQEALSLIDSFTLKNGISLDTLSSVTLMMSRTDFPDGNDFVTMLNNGFELFKKKVAESSDPFNQAIGYSAIAQLALKLYNAFGFLYMDVYLGGISVAAENNLASSISAEVNQILSPPNQYIG
jgi:hypothetical protein